MNAELDTYGAALEELVRALPEERAKTWNLQEGMLARNDGDAAIEESKRYRDELRQKLDRGLTYFNQAEGTKIDWWSDVFSLGRLSYKLALQSGRILVAVRSIEDELGWALTHLEALEGVEGIKKYLQKTRSERSELITRVDDLLKQGKSARALRRLRRYAEDSRLDQLRLQAVHFGRLTRLSLSLGPEKAERHSEVDMLRKQACLAGIENQWAFSRALEIEEELEDQAEAHADDRAAA